VERVRSHHMIERLFHVRAAGSTPAQEAAEQA
jgi:hypothetical protein